MSHCIIYFRPRCAKYWVITNCLFICAPVCAFSQLLDTGLIYIELFCLFFNLSVLSKLLF